jgi:ABC-type multidrug transport system ATPase subunit/ABC-type multidrug transport system permease subunit
MEDSEVDSSSHEKEELERKEQERRERRERKKREKERKERKERKQRKKERTARKEKVKAQEPQSSSVSKEVMGDDTEPQNEELEEEEEAVVKNRIFQKATDFNLDESRINMAKLDGPDVPVFLQFKNLTYNIKAKTANSNGKKIDRALLKGITGKVRPGEMMAVMGPTGSGKTTFLSVLSQRIMKGVTGEILVNSAPPTKDYKRQLAFVLQDDVLFPNLSVEQTLSYTAALRLGSMTAQEQLDRVNHIIDTLNLNKARKTLIGGVGNGPRGVSGGERKRVNIGNELLANPALLLLDEPTSGLDTSTAINLAQALRGLADSGMTVIASIHQPSTQVFNLFDTLLLLVDGAPIYYGKSHKAIPYFSSLGLQAPAYFNPADFMMGLILQEEISNQGGSSMKDKLTQAWSDHVKHKSLGEATKKKDIDLLEDAKEKQKKQGTPSYSTSFFEQVSILSKRSFFQEKGVQLDKVDFIQTVLIALVVGVLWFQTTAEENNIQDRVGAFFFTLVYISYFVPAFKALFNFPIERNVVKRERSSGSYRLSSYYIAKTLADFPFLFVHPTIFVVIVYFLVGFRLDVGSFFFYYALVIVNAWSSASAGIFISNVTAPDFKAGLTTLTTVFLSLMIAGGFYVSSVPVWMSWFGYLSTISYTYHAALINDLVGTEWTRNNSTDSAYASYNGTIPGQAIVDRMNPYIDNMWYNILIVLCFGIVLRTGAFFALRRTINK